MYDGQTYMEEERRNMMDEVTWRKKKEVLCMEKHGGLKKKKYDGWTKILEKRRSMMDRVVWRRKEEEA